MRHVEAQLHLLARLAIEVGGQPLAVKAADPGGDAGLLPFLRLLADPVDDAPRAAAAVEHGSRALEHFHPLDVAEIPGVLHVVAEPVEIEVVAGAEAADIDSIEAGITAGVDTGNAAQGFTQRWLAEGGQLADLDAVDGLGNQLGWRIGTGSGGNFLMLGAFANHSHGFIGGLGSEAGAQQCQRDQRSAKVRVLHIQY